MTETASLTATAHRGQAARSTTTTASFPGKTLPPTTATATTISSTTNTSSISGGPSLSFHSHRQSHNSSKLPSFRFADIKTSTRASAAQRQSLSLSPRQVPPPLVTSPTATDPVHEASPSAGPDTSAHSDAQTAPPAAATTLPETSAPKPRVSANISQRLQDSSKSGQDDSPLPATLRTRPSSYQQSTSTASSVTDHDRKVRRPASFPDSLAEETAQSSELSRTSSLRHNTRRPPAFRSAHGVATARGPPLSLNTRRQVLEAAAANVQPAPPDTTSSKERTQGQRELLLSKALTPSSPPDENRDQPPPRPPVSNDPPVSSNSSTQSSTSSTAVRVPPIRSFRSSGSRKSLVGVDMNFQTRPYDLSDRYSDSTRNRSHHRSLDSGRSGRRTPPSSSLQHVSSNDDTGDVFMRIASEEAARRTAGESSGEDRNATYRANRSSHRRPYSTIVTSYNPASPPRVNRRLSDQESRGPSGRYDDDLASEVTRSLTYRPHLREKAASAHPAEDTYARTGTSGLRPSPMDHSGYSRRRPSVAEPSGTAPRSPVSKAPALVQGHNKTYQSSPLTRSFDLQNHTSSENGNAVEGTESTASTNAPSTVWDELDDLKSRINRLELTGKLPPTSSAAVIKSTEERPPTATTTVTTMSLSPKKSANGQPADAGSNALPQREAHPHLHSALAKTKAILSPEVYRALETATHDALALSSLMGQPGHPGPVSSAASVIGSGPVITDRQLRRRADSVCRSLTELCIALGDDNHRPPAVHPPQANTASQTEGPATPTTTTKSSNFPISRRPSISTEQTAQITSPRAMSKFEERRNMILSGSALPAPRLPASNPTTPNDAMAARRSSLIVSRTRRAGTEEPEDGRRSSIFLRPRRAGTEEPEEGRRTSFLVRGRHGNVGEDNDETAKLRSPSRAFTEVNGLMVTREYPPHVSDNQGSRLDPNSQAQPSLNRRRFLSTNLHSARQNPTLTSTLTPTRKYLERPGPEIDSSGGERPAEARFSRHLPINQSSLLSRTGSLQVRRTTNRESMIAPPPSTATADGPR